MKNSVIKDVFNGVKGNIEAMGFNNRSRGNLKDMADCYDKLKKRCSEKQIKLLDKFLEAYNRNYGDEIDFYFTEGFKLGLRIAVECFED